MDYKTFEKLQDTYLTERLNEHRKRRDKATLPLRVWRQLKAMTDKLLKKLGY